MGRKLWSYFFELGFQLLATPQKPRKITFLGFLLRAHSTHFSKLTHSTHFSVINARMKSAFIQFLVELSIDIPLLLIRHNLPC